MRTKICEVCDREYPARRGKFCCSIKCRDVRQLRKPKVLFVYNCEICGKHVEKARTGKLCSRGCVGEFNRRKRTGQMKIERVVVRCARDGCETMFERPKSDGTVRRYKRFCSKRCKGIFFFDKIRPVFHSRLFDVKLNDGTFLKVRSRWEAAFIKQFLEKKNLKWSYEPKTFVLDDGRGYTPDFLIEDNGCYIEIKGFDGNRGGLRKVELLRSSGENVVYADADTLTDVYGLDLSSRSLDLAVEKT